jgi:hypothetical protein
MRSSSSDTPHHRRASHHHPLAPDDETRIYDALTELHAYALALDGERQRISAREAATDRSTAPSELRQLRCRDAEIAEQLAFIHATIAALRRIADPLGSHL